MTEIGRWQIVRPTRDEIALALDGRPSSTREQTAAPCRAALTILEPAMPQRFARLRQLGAVGLVAASDRFDDTIQLLRLLGVDTVPTSTIPDTRDWPGVVFVGCQRLTSHGQHHWFERLLARGAVVVTSDQSAAVPMIASRLRPVKRRPARRARLARAIALRGERRGWNGLPDSQFPAVRLAPGHLPLARQPRGVTVLAGDRLTGAPQVVLATVGGGQVLHSVAHWWQETEPDPTEFGRRQLADIPAFASVMSEFSTVRFGDVGAALALVDCLVSGIDLALDRAGVFKQVRGVERLYEGDLHGSAA